MKKFTEDVRNEFQFLDYAQIAFVSAKESLRLRTLFPYIKESSENHKKRVQSSTLNEVVTDAISMNPTPTDKGRRLNVFYTTQVAIEPPTFVVFVNDVELMHFSYKRYLENQIRDAFGFEGTPIHIIPRKEINQQRDLKMTKITVFGMGSFGTALANVLAQNGHDVLMWGKITIV